MSVERDLIESINDESIELLTLTDLAISFGPDDWCEVLDDDLLSDKGKIRLLYVVGKKVEYKSLVLRMASQLDFGLIIAREVTSDKRWTALGDIKAKNGVVTGGAVDVYALANLITDKSMLFWVFNILFSRAFLRALSTIVHDSSKASRRFALNLIRDINGDDVIDLLKRALDDTNKENRKLALDILKEKLTSDEINGFVQEEKSTIDGIKSNINDVKGKINELISSLPGLGFVLGGVSSVKQKGSDIASGVSDVGGSVSTGIKSKFSSLFKKLSKDDGSPEFALYLALAWADGVIEKDEARVLKDIASDSHISDKLLKWVDEKPSLGDLKEYLLSLEDVEECLKEAASILQVKYTEDTKTFLCDLEAFLGVKNIVAKERVA